MKLTEIEGVMKDFTRRVVLISALSLAECVIASGQIYTSSGSTGSDGALGFPKAKAGDVILFNPKSFTPPLNPKGDNIFNFTTITIPAGVTVKLAPPYLTSTVYWLATGAVDIEGTLDLSGGAGQPSTNFVSQRIPSIPGPGGYAGGVGAAEGQGGSQPGSGPGGGAVNNCGRGSLDENTLLVPLFGGSGGGGSYNNTAIGPGGGAGGGALLVASSTTIMLNGAISATGGAGGAGGYGNQGPGDGSGGAVRLVAATISGAGAIDVSGGNNPACGIYGIVGGVGAVRLEANNLTFTGSITGSSTSGTPFATFVPTSNTVPTLQVVSVAGKTVNPSPTGSFQIPDVTINSSSAVPLVVQAGNVPVGTIIHLLITSENGPDIAVDTPPLAGTLKLSSTTANLTFPPGFSHGSVTASFTSQ